MTDIALIARKRPYLLIGCSGIVLIALFLQMGVMVKTMPVNVQFIWQVVTGLLLTMLVIYQCVLLIVRIVGANAKSHYKAHRWLGVFSTFVFALHALSFGYGWTMALVIVFILSAITGMLNREIVRYLKPWKYKLWYWSHVTLSINLLPLVAVHIWVALAYEGL